MKIDATLSNITRNISRLSGNTDGHHGRSHNPMCWATLSRALLPLLTTSLSAACLWSCGRTTLSVRHWCSSSSGPAHWHPQTRGGQDVETLQQLYPTNFFIIKMEHSMTPCPIRDFKTLKNTFACTIYINETRSFKLKRRKNSIVQRIFYLHPRSVSWEE